jgi:hypothetical protein
MKKINGAFLFETLGEFCAFEAGLALGKKAAKMSEDLFSLEFSKVCQDYNDCLELLDKAVEIGDAAFTQRDEALAQVSQLEDRLEEVLYDRDCLEEEAVALDSALELSQIKAISYKAQTENALSCNAGLFDKLCSLREELRLEMLDHENSKEQCRKVESALASAGLVITILENLGEATKKLSR